MPRFGLIVTWSELTGTKPTMALLREQLAPFRLSGVLLGLARITAVLKSWQNEHDFARDQGLARQFLPTYFPGLQRLCESGMNRMIFTRLNLLFVAKQACIACGTEGADIRSGDDQQRVLSCCLMANDLALARQPAAQDSTIEKAVSLLPFSNYVSHDTYPVDLSRSLLLIEEIAPQLAARNDYVDLAATFGAATGVTAREFCELAFASAIKFMLDAEGQMQNPSTALILTPQYFRPSAIPPERVNNFLARLSITDTDLHARASEEEKLASNFLLFQRYPLIEFTPGSFLCPDPGFLLDKAGRSFYWTLHDARPSDRRSDLLAYWGTVVERYAQWLFEQTYRGRGWYRSSPQFTNGDEACDAYLVEGSSLVLFEIKASTLTVAAKYGFAPDKLREELQRKAIVGEEGERKGVAQLGNTLKRFLDGYDLPDVDRNLIKTIYPVLVFLDDGFTAPFLNQLYNEHFDSSGLRFQYRRRVTPLFSITIDDLESVLPYTHRHQFSDILDSYSKANKDRHGRLSRSRVPLLDGEKPGNDLIRERFHRFGSELVERFFPNSTEKTNAELVDGSIT